MAKQQRKKSRPSWFQKQIERGGEDFLLRKQPLDIQREALNIVRDIARGNIAPRDYEYLFNMKILSNVRIAIYNTYIELHTYDSALTFVMQTQFGSQTLENIYHVSPDNFQKVFNNTKNKLMAYLAILQVCDSLIAFTQSDYPKSKDDYLQIYSTVQYQLSRFRYII